MKSLKSNFKTEDTIKVKILNCLKTKYFGIFPKEETLKRPIYVIGHRCNDIEDVTKAFENKANAVECDIWLDDDEIWWVNHDKFRTTKLLDWLEEAKREITF
jgi:hypothetical protein